MAGIELVNIPEPMFIPGYTGYCPQYRYRIGDTYGQQTHKLLLDPTVNRSEKLVLANRTADDYQVKRPAQNDIDIVQSRFRFGDPVYKHPMLPGYEGFVPRMNDKFGQNYTVSATEGMAEFERLQEKDRVAINQLERQGALQDGSYLPKDLDDRKMTESEFRLPLLAVRPEAVGVLRNLTVEEPATPPPGHSSSPYFKNCSDPDKVFKLGFTGHIPYGYSSYGEGFAPMTNSMLCNFTSNYRHRQSTEWAPVTISRPDPPLMIQPTEIYHKHVGMIPNYRGHIPGAQFRFGKTYGNDSRDGKRWLRGDFTT